MTTLKPIVHGASKCTITYSRDDEEYTVRLYVNNIYKPNADYFTNDRDDAIGTAKEMARTYK